MTSFILSYYVIFLPVRNTEKQRKKDGRRACSTIVARVKEAVPLGNQLPLAGAWA